MTCRACGAEIADKAIVCYRCGTPTAEAPVRPVTGKGRLRWGAAPVMLVIGALGAWLIPKTPPGSAARIAAWVVTWLVVFATVTWLKGRRT